VIGRVLTLACGEVTIKPDYGKGEWGHIEPRLRAKTRMLVRRHKASIKRVAETLLAKTTLSGAQLDKLVGGGRRRVPSR